jgi:hypothetical protein
MGEPDVEPLLSVVATAPDEEYARHRGRTDLLRRRLGRTAGD